MTNQVSACGPFSSVSAAHHFGSDRRTADIGWTCCWSDPVANDPKAGTPDRFVGVD